MTKHPIITIIGNVGSGKSTLTDLLAKGLKAHQVDADSLFKINPFFSDFVKDMQRWALPTELWFLHQRVKIMQQLGDMAQYKPVVIDSGLLMGFAYAYNGFLHHYLSRREWELYLAFYEQIMADQLCMGDIVVYLKTKTPVLLERIKQRGREFEIKEYNDKYLSELGRSLDFLETKLRQQNIRIIEIDEEREDFIKTDNLKSLVSKISSL